MEKEPELGDFYDVHDPRGCSHSEYVEWQEAVEDYKKRNNKKEDE